MPPKASRVTSVVRAPSSAARNAAITPAGPAPMTTTSAMDRRRLLTRSARGGRPFSLRGGQVFPKTLEALVDAEQGAEDRRVGEQDVSCTVAFRRHPQKRV